MALFSESSVNVLLRMPGGHYLFSRLYTKSRKDVDIFIERQYDRLYIKNKSKEAFWLAS